MKFSSNRIVISFTLYLIAGILALVHYKYILAFFGVFPSICSEMVGDFSECNIPADEQILYGLGSIIIIILILGIQFRIYKK